MRESKTRTALYWMFSVAVIYFAVSVLAYSCSHPDMTEMRKLMNTWEAVTWDWSEEVPDAE